MFVFIYIIYIYIFIKWSTTGGRSVRRITTRLLRDRDLVLLDDRFAVGIRAIGVK